MLFFITIFIVATFFLMLVRRFFHWQITQPIELNFTADYQANQFGIKHLIVLTTIVAIAFGLFRTLLVINPKLEWQFPAISEAIVITCITFDLIYTVIIISWYTLAYLGKITYLIFVAIFLGVIIDLAVFFMFKGTAPSGVRMAEIIQPILFIQLGAGLSGFVTTRVIRLCGFRMVRVRNPLA